MPFLANSCLNLYSSGFEKYFESYYDLLEHSKTRFFGPRMAKNDQKIENFENFFWDIVVRKIGDQKIENFSKKFFWSESI